MKVILIILNIFFSLSLVLWFLIFPFTGLLFSEVDNASKFGYFLGICVVLYPLPLFIGLIGYLDAYQKNSLKDSLKYTKISLIGPGFISLCILAVILFN